MLSLIISVVLYIGNTTFERIHDFDLKIYYENWLILLMKNSDRCGVVWMHFT